MSQLAADLASSVLGCGRGAEVTDVANAGLLRPPIIYLASTLIGVVLHLVWPLPLLSNFGTPLGIGVLLLAALLLRAAVREFRAAGTSVRGNQPTNAIVPTGPYRFSRNPIYVSFSLIQLGTALWVNSLWVVITLLGALTLMSLVVIAREERYLEHKFGATYLDYKASVRRWL